MTTGPEHYRQAETDIQESDVADNLDVASFYLARAQVHATLALAATQAAANAGVDEALGRDTDAWRDVLR